MNYTNILLLTLIVSTTSITYTMNLNEQLFQAVINQDLKQVKQLLTQGADVNAKDTFDRTPLYDPAICGHTQLAELLLQHGAHVNARDNWGWTLLHCAAYKGHTQIAELLLQHGAHVNAQNNGDWAPLHWAAYNGHTQAAELLLQHDARVNAKTSVSLTPLHLAVDSGYAQIVELLLQQDADVNAQDYSDWTPLHWAANNGYTQIAGLLLKHGAKVNAKNNIDITPLHLAADRGHIQVVELLLQQGADVNTQDNWGSTPLNLAALKGHAEVRALLSNYEQLLKQVQTNPTQELLTHAIELGYYSLVKLLITKNIKPTVDNLKLAKQKYNQAQEQWQKNIYKQIGQLLIQYLRLVGNLNIPKPEHKHMLAQVYQWLAKQLFASDITHNNTYGPISKSGITSDYGLDTNIAQVIAQFLN